MNFYNILIEDTNENYPCLEDQSLLNGMEKLAKKGIPVGCRGGGCGICKVQITEGEYFKKVMSREHISSEDEKKALFWLVGFFQ